MLSLSFIERHHPPYLKIRLKLLGKGILHHIHGKGKGFGQFFSETAEMQQRDGTLPKFYQYVHIAVRICAAVCIGAK